MGRRLNALLEVTLVFILMLMVPMLIIPAIFSLFPDYLSLNILGHNPYTFLAHMMYLAIFLAIVVLAKRDLSQYGISLSSAGSDLKVAAICFVTICIIPIVLGFLPWNFIGINGGFKITLLGWAIQLLMLFVTAKLLMSAPYKEDKVAIGTLIIIPAMLLPSVSGIPTIAQALIMNFVLFFLIVGPIEELVFRGYMQSRLNEAFDCPYRFFGVSWGAGIIITSLLFGFAHVTGYNVNLLTGNYSLDWLFGISSVFFGLTMGFIREKTGNITAPSIVHGASNFFLSIMSYL
jgi:membrane protease YdiL (CAAX protease family)